MTTSKILILVVLTAAITTIAVLGAQSLLKGFLSPYQVSSGSLNTPGPAPLLNQSNSSSSQSASNLSSAPTPETNWNSETKISTYNFFIKNGIAPGDANCLTNYLAVNDNYPDVNSLLTAKNFKSPLISEAIDYCVLQDASRKAATSSAKPSP